MRDGQNNIKDMSKHIPKLKDGSKYIREETKRGFSFLKHFIIFPQEIREINKWGGGGQNKLGGGGKSAKIMKKVTVQCYTSLLFILNLRVAPP